MKNDIEEPACLADLGDLLPAEVLSKFNGNIVFNIYIGEPLPQPQQKKTLPRPLPKGRGENTMKDEPFDDNTPLSALFRENHHEELRKVIESWRPYLINDETDRDALMLTHFTFDKKSIHSKEIYVGLLNLANIGALQVSLSQLARYLSNHSNLSNSYTALYQQIKHYRQEWQ